MANTKISGATAATSLGATDELPVASSGASKKITGANLKAAMAGYEFGYDAITSDVTVSATSESSGTTVITCAAHTFDGGPVWAHFFCEETIMGSGASNFLVISLFEGSTQIARLANYFSSLTQTLVTPCNGWFRFTPSAGSHTYSITAYRNNANCTIKAGSGGTAASPPAFVRFLKA